MFENVKHCEKSDIGLLRQNNEDNFLVVDQHSKNFDLRGLGIFFVIADGMGGHVAGEVASKLACEEVVDAYYRDDLGSKDHVDDSGWKMGKLEKAIWSGHKRLINFTADKEEMRGMGTTLSALVLTNRKSLIAHVGDSRIYRCRKKRLERMTIDHTRNQALIDMGQIRPDHENNHYYGHIITQALGGYDDLFAVFTRVDDVERGDVFLLSTDGLHDLVTDEEIQEILMENKLLPTACDELVQTAIRKGGDDNITVIVVQI